MARGEAAAVHGHLGGGKQFGAQRGVIVGDAGGCGRQRFFFFQQEPRGGVRNRPPADAERDHSDEA
jgi:hypothetical protein